MSIDRDSMLDRLGTLPGPELSKLIFKFDLGSVIAENVAPAERAISLIQAVETKGKDAWEKLESLVEPAEPPLSSASNDAAEADSSNDDSLESWRDCTITEFVTVFRKLRSEDCRGTVSEIMGFPANSGGESLADSLDEFIRRYSEADTFDIKSISLIVAKCDALRTESGTHPDDAASLGELQNLLFPLTVHPEIKVQVASQMGKRDGAFISESVAQAVSAELVAAPADGRSAEFRLDDNGRISGKGLLRFVDAAIGDPDPDNVVGEILQDLADQLSVGLDEDIEDEPDLRKRIIAWADELRLAIDVHQARTKLRFYCVVQCPGTTAARDKLAETLGRVRQEVPELVFFELRKMSSTKRAGEVVMQILKDRFRGEG